MDYQKVDLSPIKAIAHDGVNLQILIERDGTFQIENLPAPAQAFEGLQQLARFAALIQEMGDGRRPVFEHRSATQDRLVENITILPIYGSSTIAGIGYSDALRVLQVNFLNGSSYRYFNVPYQVFQGFLKAPSKGHYLNEAVKSEGFEYAQIR